MSDTEKITADTIIIINNRVGELGFYLTPYGRVAGVNPTAKGTQPFSKDSLQPLEKVRFMPGMNLPMVSAVVGAARRACTEDEVRHVLQHQDFKRQTELGTLAVYKSLTEIPVSERSKIARNCSDTHVLRAWLEQETHDKVKVEIQAQLTEINDKGNDGDYRDVRNARPEHSDHPNI
jgi:hypothetical protein